MPVLFVGHGSPMNGIENNIFSQYWKRLAEDIPRPSAVLVISAHWLTRGNTKITAMPSPRTIHDFMGFPQRLFDVRYPAPGHPQLARDMQEVVQQVPIEQDHEWGLDHGTWSIVRHMYPDANIPVLQLSIDFDKPAQFHYELAQELAVLRRQGVLIIGSGNMVHNLRMMDFSRLNTESYGFDWAIALNDIFKDRIANGDHQSLLEYEKLHEASRLAIPTPDHYFPLIYTLGLQNKKDQITFFNDRAVAGSITMTSVKFGD
ncbi:MAG: 4,5-DOPA dioxygenase extradiol [Fulvivirga sp.]|nr:4,5-DOPA dioxygenase extradiol [Fulvivirga sp.]